MILSSLYQDGHSKDSQFQEQDSVHKYNPTHTLRLLQQKFADAGVEIHSADLNKNKPVAFELHVEGRSLTHASIPRYLIALENPYINGLNADPDYLKQFKKVFTWDRRFFDLPNVVPIMVPNQLSWKPFPTFEKRTIFACLINANKNFPVELDVDLYQERLKVIRWYEQNAPEMFALFGRGWHKPPSGITLLGKLVRHWGRMKTRMFGFKPFPSYRGEVEDKNDAMGMVKFSYCYENVRNLSNYITEKMIDSFLAGSVPIYWGADNVKEHVPENCFIDRRDFKDTAEVHQYLTKIDQNRYMQYQNAISQFLQGEGQIFGSECFVDIIAENIISIEKSTR